MATQTHLVLRSNPSWALTTRNPINGTINANMINAAIALSFSATVNREGAGPVLLIVTILNLLDIWLA